MNLKQVKITKAYLLYIWFGATLSIQAQVGDPALEVKDDYNELSVYEIVIDSETIDREFEGVGALSAGASSRLLYDYPEPQRSEILDYLFKPNFGANFQHLKVEIGGDVNSTDGSEPSHAITRNEFENPKPEYFFRGYEWWLMKEAKKRNPDIILEGLQWGAPGWIGNGNFFSEDNARFISSWIKGMKTYHNLDIDFVGIRNERTPDMEYIPLLRKILDKNNLEYVKIDAGDLWEPQRKWEIADSMIKNNELRESVDVINAHTTAMTRFYTPESAHQLNIPLWDGEAHAYGGDWYAAAEHARFNRAYVYGKITKIISWSLITSYHDFLVVPHSGPMKANTPWSGHYEVQPPIWVIAHTNQFAKIGWRYIESASKAWNRTRELMLEGFSSVALKAENTSDYTVIIETMDAKEIKKVRLKVSDDLSKKNLKVWRSVFNKEEFNQIEDLEIINGEGEITLLPNAIYTLTTTTGQQKGGVDYEIPNDRFFPFPYTSTFNNDTLGSPAQFFSDQHGTFEVVENPLESGNCLKQMVPIQGIQWRTYDFPESIIGDVNWSDYTVSVDVMISGKGTVNVGGRRNDFYGSGSQGYNIHFDQDGLWKLYDHQKLLSSGSSKFSPNKWHKVKMSFEDDEIEVYLDEKKIVVVNSDSNPKGLVVLGSGWNEAYFDNLKIESNH